MPEQETTQNSSKAPKKKGVLGCSFPIFIFVLVFFLALFVIGFASGAIGKSMFGGVSLPAWLSVPKPHPELPAEVLFNLGAFPVTNSILTTWITMGVVFILFFSVSRRLKVIPGRLQSVLEFAIEALLTFCQSVAGKENGRRFFPIVATIFLFVIFNSWLSLLPGFGSVGVIKVTPEGLNGLVEEVESLHLSHEVEATLLAPLDKALDALNEGHTDEAIHNWETFIETAKEESDHGLTGEQADELVLGAKEMEPHLLRGANTDINTPLALAFVSFIAVWAFGFKSLGVGYLKQFFNADELLKGLGNLARGKAAAGLNGIFMGVINIFVGLIELLSQFVRLISFTLRLFGNMTAGEILLLMVTFLIPYLVALPFYGLEILVGFVQALIFGGLTLIFLTMAVASHEHSEEAHK